MTVPGKNSDQPRCPISIGSDCSGIEGVQTLLKGMGIPFKSLFVSEISELALKWIRLNGESDIIYRDITEREVEKVSQVDLYLAGSPCMPFSSMNTRKRLDDPRREVIEHCLEYVAVQKPKIFILEQVRGLLSCDQGSVWKQLSQELDALNYIWDHTILCPTKYNCPQSRPRVYIVGIRKDLGVRTIPWPKEQKLQVTCLDLLDEHITEGRKIAPCYMRMVEAWGIDPKTKCVLEFNGAGRSYPKSKGKLTEKQKSAVARTEIASCVLAKDPGPAALHLGRHLTPREILRLQGYDPNQFEIPHNMTTLQVSSLAGAAFNGKVLGSLLENLVPLLQKNNA